MQESKSTYASIEIPVQWGDMDAAQHVNNTVYLRWMESARLALFTKLNAGKMEFAEIGPILAWQDCKYIFPVTYPDTVVVQLDVTTLKHDRIICTGKIYSKRYNKLAAISSNSTMAYDYRSAKKSAIPNAWIKQIIDFYGAGILDH
ncbi:MAG: thioesterase family protein [Flavobacteriaceae bacterium]